MKAVIMAGGRGTRLLPLTEGTPKPLVPLLGKPALFYILDLLVKHGVEEAALTLGYHGRQIECALENCSGLSLLFSKEEFPLGTAGGVRRALPLFSKMPEELLIISGDALCDFDLTAALEFHRASGSKATLLTKRVSDPREYGLVCADDTGRIVSFVEKPSHAGCVTDLANTGIYILSPEAVESIPKEGECDFARDIFPALLRRGVPLFAREDKGYWCDIGDVKSYLRCQADMLAGRVGLSCAARPESRPPFGSYTLHPPVYLGRNVSIGQGTEIGGGSVIGDNVRLGAGCRIEGSVVGAGAALGDRVTLIGALICAGATLDAGTAARPLSVAGAGSMIRRDAVLEEGARVWNGLVVEEGVVLREDLRAGAARELVAGEEGFSGPTDGEMTPEVCLHLGMGTASLGAAPSVGIGWSGRAASHTLACAGMAGVMAAGGTVWDFGECFGSQFDFCLSKSQADFGIYFDGGLDASARVTERCGLPLRREWERRLESAVNRREYRRAAPHEMGGVVELSNITKLYGYELLKLCGDLQGTGARVRSVSRQARALLEDTLCRLGSGENGPIIRLAADGRSAELQQDGLTLSPERTLAAACLSEFIKGNSVALPRDAPHALEGLAARYGAGVLRYGGEPDSGEEREARLLAARQPFTRDGLMMAVMILAFLARRGMTLAELDDLLPHFCVGTRYVPLDLRPGQALRQLRELAAGSGLPDGVELFDGGATAFVRPLKTGRGLMIYTESLLSETAEELCDRFESVVKKACGISRRE